MRQVGICTGRVPFGQLFKPRLSLFFQHKVTQDLGHNIDAELGNGNGGSHATSKSHATSNKLSAGNMNKETALQLLVPNGLSQSRSSVVSEHNDSNGNSSLPLQPQQLSQQLPQQLNTAIPKGIIVTSQLVVEAI